jgi:hypothetical protein
MLPESCQAQKVAICEPFLLKSGRFLRVLKWHAFLLFEVIKFSAIPSDAAMTIDKILGEAYPIINCLSLKFMGGGEIRIDREAEKKQSNVGGGREDESTPKNGQESSQAQAYKLNEGVATPINPEQNIHRFIKISLEGCSLGSRNA